LTNIQRKQLQLREKAEKKIGDTLMSLLLKNYYKPVLSIYMQKEYKNSNYTALQDAIVNGRVYYLNGFFTGAFNTRIIRDLKKFATFNKKMKAWEGLPPQEVITAIVKSKEKTQKQNEEVERILTQNEIDVNDPDYLAELYGETEAVNQLELIDTADLLEKIGVKPKLSESNYKKLKDEYIESINLKIKNWSVEATQRLREKLQKAIIEGNGRLNLIDVVNSEMKVSYNKAKFLARQETSLFTSKLRKERCLDLGINKYKWSSSQDVRVRDRHKHLNGKVFSFDNPPITDDLGNKNNPGEDYNCRCVAIPIL
jgi:SPP1 gp7 family putative phage head morphogenesis protein